jgi:Ca2+-binding RTX toxin-like protein
VRRTMLLVGVIGLALLLAAGAALAQTSTRLGDQGPGVSKTCPRDCDGTTYPDTLIGTNAPNHIEGLGGNESPTFGDYIPAHGGNDILYGNAGGDRIEGGANIDTIYGGAGENLLIGGPGKDRIYGGSGGDEIRVRDGYKDTVDCQGGNDTVSNRDPFDVLRNC